MASHDKGRLQTYKYQGKDVDVSSIHYTLQQITLTQIFVISNKIFIILIVRRSISFT